VSRIHSFALAAAALLLTAADSLAAPPSVYSPGFVQPPPYTRYPPNRAFFVPYHPATARWFAPPPSEPPNLSRAPAVTAPPSPPATMQSPATLLGPELPLVPREPEEAKGPARIEVRVPPDAELWFSGAKTRQTGAVRLFRSPALEPGQWYGYDVKARWTEGGKEVVRSTHVSVAAGVQVGVDFTKRDAK